MADIKLSIDDLPPATTVYNTDVFVIDQLGGDGYTKKLAYSSFKNALSGVFVSKSGDTMTGALLLNTSNPTNALQAASKGYADTKLPLAGGTMTGFLTLNSLPSNANHAATKQYVDNNTTPLSSAFTQMSSTLSAHGYQKMHGGLIMQWGTTAGASTSGSVDVVFPLSFTTQCFNVVVTPVNAAGTGNGTYVHVLSTSKTGAKVTFNNFYSAAFSTTSAFWQALGY